MKIIKPYAQAQPNHIISPFGANESFREVPHNGTDFAFENCYGTPLLAPIDCVITRIITPNRIIPDGNFRDLEYGYGVEMRGMDNFYYLYWHCLSIFPVNVGDQVRQSKIVAFIGNSGLVYRNGKRIPLEVRSQFPYLGSHLHAAKYIYENGYNNSPRKYYDFATEIDWAIPVKVESLDLITSAKIVLSKISNLIKDYLR